MRPTLILLLILAAPGCATVLNGTTQKVPVRSDPPGAAVVVDGGVQTHTTPAVIQLKRKHKHVLTLSLAGHESQSVTLTPTLSGAIAGNILIGGLVGGGVDLLSGGANKLTPSDVHVKLRPLGNATASVTGTAGRP